MNRFLLVNLSTCQLVNSSTTVEQVENLRILKITIPVAYSKMYCNRDCRFLLYIGFNLFLYIVFNLYY